VGTYKAEVFLASRFDEFKALRAALVLEIAKMKHLAPVDLNDGYARQRPPLAECLSRVRAAEFMILLLGDSYGPNAPGKTESFTHLEYLEAARDGSKTSVLAYRLRGLGAPNERAIPEAWLRELEERHTCCTLAGDAPAALASEIVKHLQLALFEHRFDNVSEGNDDLPDALVEGVFDDSETDALDAVEAGARGEDGGPGPETDDLDPSSMVQGPAATAALEQRNEAIRATELGEYGIAMQHLRRALELRPLDGLSSFLLARLYVAARRQDRLGEAVNLADRAARIASDEGAPFRASDAYILAARARTKMGDFAAAHGYVDRALEQRPDFAKAHLERARVFCREKKPAEAFDSVRSAFRRHNPSLYQALRDPQLSSIRGSLLDMLRKETSNWAQEVQRLLDVERQLRRLVGGEVPPGEAVAPGEKLQRLSRLGQESIARQRDVVSLLLASAERAHQDSLPETRDSAAARISGGIRRTERDLATALTGVDTATRALAEATKLPRLVDWTVAVPPAVAALLAYFVPWTGPAVMLLVAGLGLGLKNLWRSKQRLDVARARLASAETRLEQATNRRSLLENTLTEEKAELEVLRERGEQAQATARKALDIFERHSLSMPGRYQPYSNLRRARPGKLVRISTRTVDEFEKAYRRRIERDESRFWVEVAGTLDGFALYEVTAKSPAVIRLSRRNAYQPPPESARPPQIESM
jgi:tetratricopeptide (TPR) repeat protein